MEMTTRCTRCGREWWNPHTSHADLWHFCWVERLRQRVHVRWFWFGPGAKWGLGFIESPFLCYTRALVFGPLEIRFRRRGHNCDSCKRNENEAIK